MADTLGLSDEALSSIILTYLKKHKNEIFYSISPQKSNLKIMIDTLSLQCFTTAEVTQMSCPDLKESNKIYGDWLQSELSLDREINI